MLPKSNAGKTEAKPRPAKAKGTAKAKSNAGKKRGGKAGATGNT